jgi:hypothetical protein
MPDSHEEERPSSRAERPPQGFAGFVPLVCIRLPDAVAPRTHGMEKRKDTIMLIAKKLKAAFFGLILTAAAVVTPSASADTRIENSDAQRQVAERLAEFKRTASKLRHEADTLNASRNSRVSWETHTYQLGNVSDHVNQLGRSLAELEDLKPMASENQRVAIEQARPHLAAIARNTTRAFELIKENRGSIHFPDFGEAASDIYSHADSLHTKLDAILDFEKAKERLGNLELQPMPGEGS